MLLDFACLHSLIEEVSKHSVNLIQISQVGFFLSSEADDNPGVDFHPAHKRTNTQQNQALCFVSPVTIHAACKTLINEYMRMRNIPRKPSLAPHPVVSGQKSSRDRLKGAASQQIAHSRPFKGIK